MGKLDPGFKTSEGYKPIYDKWKRMKKYGVCEAWKDFDTFAEWALDNGYSPFGCTLKKRNTDDVYSPGNCYFFIGEKKVVQDFVKNWNTAVNRIREHYGMEPFEVWADGDA